MRLVQIYTAVDAIARLGSIRRAADTLAISPSALNRQILALESELGVPLFDRLSSGVRLSTAGEIYIKAFRDHLSDLKRVESQIADLSGQRIGTVRIGVGPEIATGFLVRHVSTYHQIFPKVHFCLEPMSFDALADGLIRRDIDIALAVEPILAPGLLPVATEPAQIVAVSAAPLSNTARLAAFSDLAQRPLIVPTRRSGLRNAIDAAFTGRRMTPRYLVETDAPVTRELLARDDALWIAAEINLSGIEDAGLTVTRFAPGTLPDVQIQLFQLENRSLSVTASSILTRIATELAQ